MTDFFKHAWRNPRTSFLLGGAFLGLVLNVVSDGQPFTVVKALKIGVGAMGILGSCAASDAATAAAGANSVAATVSAVAVEVSKATVGQALTTAGK